LPQTYARLFPIDHEDRTPHTATLEAAMAAFAGG
jgi:hypothetical protein